MQPNFPLRASRAWHIMRKNEPAKENTFMKHTLSTSGAPAAIGPYAQGVQAGQMVFVSGQLPIDPATGCLCTGTVADMTCRSMQNIAAILAEAGCTLQDVVKTTIFLKDLEDFAQVNAAYATFFPENPPARACVQVARLPKDALVEIEAIAVKRHADK